MDQQQEIDKIDKFEEEIKKLKKRSEAIMMDMESKYVDIKRIDLEPNTEEKRNKQKIISDYTELLKIQVEDIHDEIKELKSKISELKENQKEIEKREKEKEMEKEKEEKIKRIDEEEKEEGCETTPLFARMKGLLKTAPRDVSKKTDVADTELAGKALSVAADVPSQGTGATGLAGNALNVASKLLQNTSQGKLATKLSKFIPVKTLTNFAKLTPQGRLLSNAAKFIPVKTLTNVAKLTPQGRLLSTAAKFVPQLRGGTRKRKWTKRKKPRKRSTKNKLMGLHTRTSFTS
jgi:hypothetical protein